MILMCHQVNITGQIFPVKRICNMARELSIEVMVDGAHSFAQFVFQHSDRVGEAIRRFERVARRHEGTLWATSALERINALKRVQEENREEQWLRLSRDLERFDGLTTRIDRCPLGAGALAGGFLADR